MSGARAGLRRRRSSMVVTGGGSFSHQELEAAIAQMKENSPLTSAKSRKPSFMKRNTKKVQHHLPTQCT